MILLNCIMVLRKYTNLQSNCHTHFKHIVNNYKVIFHLVMFVVYVNVNMMKLFTITNEKCLKQYMCANEKILDCHYLPIIISGANFWYNVLFLAKKKIFVKCINSWNHVNNWLLEDFFDLINLDYCWARLVHLLISITRSKVTFLFVLKNLQGWLYYMLSGLQGYHVVGLVFLIWL